MKISRWSSNVTLAEKVAKVHILETAGVISLTLTKPKGNGSHERINLQFTRAEMEEILEHAQHGKWSEDKLRGGE